MQQCPDCGRQIISAPSEPIGLTKRQRSVLQYLSDYESERGHIPDYKTVCDHFNWSSTANYYRYIDQLERRGYVRTTVAVAGSLQILQRP